MEFDHKTPNELVVQKVKTIFKCSIPLKLPMKIYKIVFCKSLFRENDIAKDDKTNEIDRNFQTFHL